MAAVGKFGKSRPEAALELLQHLLEESFMDWQPPGRPDRFLRQACDNQLSPLKASDIFRKLRSLRAFQLLMADITRERTGSADLLREFSASLNTFIDLGKPDDLFCMYRTGDPANPTDRGWIWLTSDLKIIANRPVA